MRVTWLGIDPGIGGAIASLRPGGRARVYDAPVTVTKVKDPKRKLGFRNRKEYDVERMLRLLRAEIHTAKGDGFAIRVSIERQQPMPSTKAEREEQGESHSKGTVGAWKSGWGYGLWMGLLWGVGLGPYTSAYVPRTWRARFFKQGTQGKGASIVIARELFPDMRRYLERTTVDHGRAEALLIAEFGRSRNQQEQLF